MSKHTPGPWVFDEYDNINNSKGQIIRAKGLALSSGIEAQANAKLIAAAPELLEALEDVMSYLRAIDETVDITYQYKAAKAAINKATGE